MGGHDLVFRCEDHLKYIRFRSGPTFVNPGKITLDGVSLSMYAYSSVRAMDAGGSSTTAPALKLRNGAFANFANGAVTAGVPEPKDVALLFDTIDCEAGTGFKKLGESSDTAGPITVVKLVGCPTVSADQTLTIRDEFQVRRTDLLAEPANILVAATNLAFASTCAMTLDSTDGLALSGDGVIVARAPRGMIAGRPRETANAGFYVRKDGDAQGEKIRLTAGPASTVFIVR